MKTAEPTITLTRNPGEEEELVALDGVVVGVESELEAGLPDPDAPPSPAEVELVPRRLLPWALTETADGKCGKLPERLLLEMSKMRSSLRLVKLAGNVPLRSLSFKSKFLSEVRLAKAGEIDPLHSCFPKLTIVTFFPCASHEIKLHPLQASFPSQD